MDVFNRLIEKWIRNGFLKGLSIRGGGAHISHLWFDDDTLLSSSHDYFMLNNLKNVSTFEMMSGLGLISLNLSWLVLILKGMKFQQRPWSVIALLTCGLLSIWGKVQRLKGKLSKRRMESQPF